MTSDLLAALEDHTESAVGSMPPMGTNFWPALGNCEAGMQKDEPVCRTLVCGLINGPHNKAVIHSWSIFPLRLLPSPEGSLESMEEACFSVVTECHNQGRAVDGSAELQIL